MCRFPIFPIFVAPCDHNPLTSQTDRRPDRRHVRSIKAAFRHRHRHPREDFCGNVGVSGESARIFARMSVSVSTSVSRNAALIALKTSKQIKLAFTTPTPTSSPTSSRGSSRECRRVVQLATGITSANRACRTRRRGSSRGCPCRCR